MDRITRLVLTRGLGEAVVIGHEVTARIVRIDRTRVRLLISAPETVAIRREELPLPPPPRRAA